MSAHSQSRVLGSFAIAMISISAILSLRGLPMMASVGLQSLFFYGLAALCFLIPSALVCAELATSLPINGGVYTWTRTAFGGKVGFLAMWMEWINNVIAFPTTLSSIVATIAYIGFPQLAQNKFYLFAVMMLVYWGCTFFNMLGIKTTSRLNILGALFGTILPGAFIIILGIVWLALGHPVQVSLTPKDAIPPFQIGSLVFFLGVLSAYAGMQITAFHAQDVRNPQKTYPRAMFLATILIFIISSMAAMSIAFVVPGDQINLLNGLIESFSVFFKAFHISWFTPILAALIAFGGVASMSAWLIGPARGLREMSVDGEFPKVFAKLNKYGMPSNILLLQGVIGTLLACVFLFMPSLKSAFWTLVAWTSQFTVLMYILLFSAAIKLRYSQPNLERPYRIPGGKLAIWLICGVAILVCIIGFLLGLFPPNQISIHNSLPYIGMMLIGDAVILAVPLAVIMFKRNKVIAG
ncbi:MAG: amino acid permease family protein [Gammaproteobacteria bacterium]|jgi:amino acid transporter|nr:amino acid permease family protein [Gammaproteobacteria bacterium]